MVNISGRVSSLSHSFRQLDGWQFFITLDSGGRNEHILVQEPKLQEWHQYIKIHRCYTITCLHSHYMDVGSEAVQVFTTCCHSTVSRIQEEQRSALHHSGEGSCKELQHKVLSCKTKVAQVMDEEAGIYLLSNGAELYITFLKDLTGELWNGEEPIQTPTQEASVGSSSSGSTLAAHKCLTVGDTIKVLRCHYVKQEKKVRLVCCGQSCIVNKSRKFVLKPHWRQRAAGVTELIHSLNLSFQALIWLLKLKEEVISIVPCTTSGAAELPPGGSVCGMLTALLNEAKRRNLFKERKRRSLVEEFLEPIHECSVMQDFVHPLDLVSLKHILHEQEGNKCWSVSGQDQQTSGSSSSSEFWNYCVSAEGEWPGVLVGRLGAGQDGVLQLVQAEATMDLVIIGNAGMSLRKYGGTVALFHYQLVKETFHVNETNPTDVHKLYIVARGSDLVLLEPEKECSLSRQENYSKYSFKFRLLSKSALLVPHARGRNFSLVEFLQNRFFVGMAHLMKIGCEGEVLETWQRIVKFSGSNAGLYPFIEVGDECELRLPSVFNAEAALKRPQEVHLMNYLSGGQSVDCLLLPQNTYITKVNSVQMKWGEVSVQEAQAEGHQSELITIIGTVMRKTFVAPTYDSEVSRLPHGISENCHIGVPRGMKFRLLIRDESDNDNEVWLYVTCTTSVFTKIYPLFVLPGVKIIATDLKRNMAKNSKNVYFLNSHTTHIIPVSSLKSQGPLTIHETILLKPKYSMLGSLLNSDSTHVIPASSLESQEPMTIHETTVLEPKYIMLGNQPHPETFIIFARVENIRRASLKVVCKICEYRMKKHYRHRCWNCFAESPSEIKASVEVAVDDGTDTTLILLKGVRQLAVLLRLSRRDCARFCDIVFSECLSLQYDAFNAECGQAGGSASISSEQFRMMITEAELAHSYKFTCKKQRPPPHLCLELSQITPNQDIKLLQ